MIVAMQERATEEQIDAVIDAMTEAGVDVHRTTGTMQTILAGVGPTAGLDLTKFEVLPGVLHVHRISSPYKLAGRAFRPEGTVVEFANGAPNRVPNRVPNPVQNPVRIGGTEVQVIAGPCAIEDREQIFAIAKCVQGSGAKFLRGGAFKPRSSPYSFQGLGIPGLELMREAADAHGLLTVSEVMEIAQIEPMLPFVDCFQVGARNMQNFNLLRELGQARKPVLLKRGIAATIEELLLSSEYIMSGGNYNVILCERGIRTYETSTRNTMDIAAIPVLKKLSHLPVVADPSHGTGRRDMVPPMAKAAVAAGADALLMEIHPNADKAASDAAQTLYLEQFEILMNELRAIAAAVGRTL
ncbi:MAG: 3-deoxy-7-phosphoheptulonate synthase [Terracidiphilus sp.]